MTFEEVTKDQDFQALPAGEQRKVLSIIDTDYRSLPEREQDKVLKSLRTPTESPSAQPSMLHRGLDALAIPGDYTRGAIAGQMGKRLDPSQFTDAMSEGGTEQVLRERGPLAATIRDTASSLVDPLLLAGPAITGARRLVGGIGQIARQPKPIPTISSEPVPPIAPPPTPTIAPSQGALPIAPLASDVTIPKYAGSVNLERIQSPDETKRIIMQASEQIAQSPSMTFEQIEKAAVDMGMTLEDAQAVARQKGRGAAQIVAARQVHAGLAKRASEAQKAYQTNKSLENWARLRDAWGSELAAFESVQTVAREMGRGLGSFKIQVEPGDVMTQARKAVNTALLELKNKGKYSDEVERRLADVDFGDGASVQQFLRYAGTKTASWREKLFEGWMASILSAPTTHAVNATSNMMFAAARPFERLGAATLELRRGGQRERYYGEAVADAFGFGTGLRDGMRTFLHTMQTEVPLSNVGKLEGSAKLPAIEGAKGKVIRTPLTLLTATDDFFKTLLTRGDLYAQAYRMAAKEGLSGKAMATKITELVQKPSRDMLDKARGDAIYRTFQQELGAGGKHLIGMREATPGLEYIIPFIQTPLNIAKAAAERTPLNLVRVAHLAKQGKLTGADLSDEGARAIMGSMVGAYIASETAAGNITGGGPVDPEQRKMLLATGWQPYSFKVGDKYYSYQRLEPMGTVFAMGADFTETMGLQTEEEKKTLSQKIVKSIVKNFGDKTFLTGISEAVKAYTDPERYGGTWIQRVASSTVPSASASYARSDDPLLRDVRSVEDSIRQRIPGSHGSKSLMPKRDYFGEPIERPGDFYSRFLSPIQVSTDKGDPVKQKLVDLGVQIAPLKRTVPIKQLDEQGMLIEKYVEMTPEQYDQAQVQAGKLAKTIVTAMVQARGFDKLPKSKQAELLKEGFDKARGVARQMVGAQMQMKNMPRPSPTALPNKLLQGGPPMPSYQSGTSYVPETGPATALGQRR